MRTSEVLLRCSGSSQKEASTKAAREAVLAKKRGGQ